MEVSKKKKTTTKKTGCSCFSVCDAHEEEKNLLLVGDQKHDEQCEGHRVTQVVFFSAAGDKRIHLAAQDGTWVNTKVCPRSLWETPAAPRLKN